MVAMKKLNLVIVATHGIGDLVMLLPTVREIVKTHTVRMVVANQGHIDLLAHCFPNKCEAVIYGNTATTKLVAFLKIVKWKVLGKVDLILPQPNLNPKTFSLLVRVLRFQMWRNDVRDLENMNRATHLHKSVLFRQYVEKRLGNVLYDFKPFAPRREFDKRNMAVIAPGALTEPLKAWPPEFFADLAKRLVVEAGVEVLVVGTAGEEALCNSIIAQVPTGEIRSATELSIGELLTLLATSKIVVANCNGLSHLAALAGCHVIGLYGPTDPVFTGPFTAAKTVVTGKLECSPCSHSGRVIGCERSLCLESIEVGDVFDACIDALTEVIP